MAEVLAISVEQLRNLVRRHILKDEADGPAPIIPMFHVSDLTLLRVLTTMQSKTAASATV